ncbi:hypothetical protein H2199_007243 [Coniosporium tulheliwenetii]|nr:hypothetical protein H2199_007243 [Cladosporium sp. JES 115]
MLHIAHHRNWLEPSKVNGKRIKLETVGPRGPHAKEVLLKSASVSLSGSDCEPYTFKDMILSIWSVLEFLLAKQVERDRNPGLTVNGPLRDVVQGFEFKAIVQRRSPIRQKQAIVQKTSGGWPALARDIDALILFANGYEDVIQPLTENSEGLCHLWKSMPRGKDYLATRVETLKDLYDLAGRPRDRKYLTSTQLQWHRGSSSLFEPCTTPRAYCCRCERLQRIVPKSAIGRVVPPGNLIHDGAVIFGQSNNFIRDIVTASHPQETSSIFSQPNVNLTLPSSIDDADGIASSVSSNEESLFQSGSDGTPSPSPSSTAHRTLPCEDVVVSILTDLNPQSMASPPVTKKRICDLDIESPPCRKAPRRDVFSLMTRTSAVNSEVSGNKHALDLHREALCSPTLCPSRSRSEDTMCYDAATQPECLHTDNHARVGECGQFSENVRAGSPDVSVSTSQEPDLPHADTNHQRQAAGTQLLTQTEEIDAHALVPGSVPLMADSMASIRFTLPPQRFDVAGQGDDPPSNNQAKHPLRRQRRFCRLGQQGEGDDRGCNGTVALAGGVVSPSGGV